MHDDSTFRSLLDIIRGSILGVLSITFVGGILGSFLRYIYQVLLGRFFGPEVLGLFAIGFVIVKGTSTICRLGLDQAAKKFVPVYMSDKTTDDLSTFVSFSLLLPFITGVVIAVGYFLIVYTTGFQPQQGSMIHLFVAGIPLFAAFITGINVLYGFGDPNSAVLIRDVVFSLILVASVVIVSSSTNGTALAIIGYVFAITVGMLLVIYALYFRKNLSVRLSRTFDYREVVRVSAPLNFIAVVVFGLGWSDIIMVTFFLDARLVGGYQAALQTSLLLTLLPTAIDRIFPSHISSLYENEEADFRPAFKALTKWTLQLSILAGSFTALYAQELLGLFGFDISQLVGVLMILLVGQVISAAAQPSQSILIGTKFQKLEMVNSLAVLVVNIVLNIVLIPKFGLIGAAVATTISYALLSCLQMVEVTVLFETSPIYPGYWRGGVAFFVVTPVVAIASQVIEYGFLELPLLGMFYLGAFLVLVYIFGVDDFDQHLLNRLGMS